MMRTTALVLAVAVLTLPAAALMFPPGGGADELASGITLAKKQKKHQNGRALLGNKIKQNGKHKLPKAGKIDVSVTVTNGKVVGLTAAHPTKGNLSVRKVKSRQKLAEAAPGVTLAGMKLAQASEWYYGYWFVDDEEDDWYYWFTADDVAVDDTWILFG